MVAHPDSTQSSRSSCTTLTDPLSMKPKIRLSLPSAVSSLVLSRFGAQNGIDFLSIAFGADTTLAYSPDADGSGGILSIGDGAHAARVAPLGSYIASSFATAADGHGGNFATGVPAASAPLLTTPHP
jgi:hypothetical protein